MLQIREMEAEDALSVAELICKEIYDGQADPREIHAWISLPEPWIIPFVAVDATGEIQGTIIWKVDELGAEVILDLGWIVLRERIQGNGTGRALVGESLRTVLARPFIRGRKISYVSTETNKENRNAIAFYRKVLRPFDEHLVLGKEVRYFYAELDEVLANTQEGAA